MIGFVLFAGAFFGLFGLALATRRPACSRELAGHKCQRNLPQGCECGRGTADGKPRVPQGELPSLFEGKKQ